MLKRIKRLWKLSGETDIVVIKEDSMTKENAYKIAKMTGKVVVMAKDVNDIKTFDKKDILDNVGDGKAEFFGEPTPEDEKEFERSEKGTKPWYDRLKNLV